MGSFGGHALPGTLFFLWGLWTAIQALRLHHQRRLRGKRYYGHAAFPLLCCCGAPRLLPWEGICKIFLPVLGMSVEGIGFLWQDLHMIQHFSMYVFFLLAGIVDLLIFSKAPIPRNLDYAMHALAFLVEGLLFQFHTHGRTPLDVLLHTLLVYGCYACAFSMILEMRYRRYVLAPLTRAFFVMSQGTWFWQAGYVLYNPVGASWDENDHDNIMLATVVAGWHLFVHFTLILVLCGLINRCYSRGEALLPTAAATGSLASGVGHGEGRFVSASRGHSEELNGLLKGDSDDDSQL